MVHPDCTEVVDPALKSFSYDPPERTVWSPGGRETPAKSH